MTERLPDASGAASHSCKSRVMLSLFDREEWQRFWWCQATDEGALLPDRRGGCPCHGAGPAAAAGRFSLWETSCI